ncbi:autotransporter outer membrane beta-barrel domain-containing protein [Sphingomonas sp.]|uniref:autotransporter outer membrane beta-barrel domain-containing protein n=1 Tax=Sphingomonas sp. TaxID=28214 RepID=UPI0028AF3736|nr:autotransporter outer membrane beta-barrel domain-containing protein [Sphingomonas sp.]
MVPVLAQAQCAPEPSIANGTTNCTGTDSDGIRISTSNTTLDIASGAMVTNTGAPAVTVEIPGSSYSIFAGIAVHGSASSDTQSGILLLSGAASTYSGATTRLSLSVDPGASVSGATAFAMGQTPGNTTALLVADIDNAGTLTGTSGVALRGDIVSAPYGYVTSYSGFARITNRASGVISGSIVGPVGSVDNAGLIDGGSNSAFTPGAAGTSYPYLISSGAWTNSGTIQSNGAAATIVSTTIGSLKNSGTIANRGSGAAINASYLDMQNDAGGQISSGGATAIVSSNYLRLVNVGTITGNVVTGNSGSVVDSTAGTINGSVLFGSGDDTLVVRYDAASASVRTGINGSINAGGGTNTEQVKFAGDVTLSAGFAPLAGFQRLLLDPVAGATVTLGANYVSTASLVLSGNGTVVNQGRISTNGPAISDINYSFNRATFRNDGAITAAISTFGYGITLSNQRFVNNGTVAVTGGNGVSMSYNDLVNTGTITATGGVGVAMFNAVLTNSGTIIGGTIGATLSGNVGGTASNSGTIRGTTAGVSTGIYFTNTGTISASGVGVQVQPYGYLINGAGGVVNGGTGGAVTVNSFNAGVANAGTINGDVSVNGFGTNNNLTYFALGGGTLNGNLRLTGATLVTDIVNSGPGAFAGITGTVTADSGSSLRYAVNADASTTLAPGYVGPFGDVGYQLANGAKLTVTAPTTQPLGNTLKLAGTGSVDLNANIAVNSASAIQVSNALTYPGTTGSGTTGALSITSRGTIAVSRATGTSSYTAAVGASLTSGDSFTNLGTITVTDRNANANTVAISGGAQVTNAGTILLDGGSGIAAGYGKAQIVNSGSIRQIAGGANATGVTGAFDLTNSGTIQVGGTAVVAYNRGQIRNTGTIASSGGAAITGSDSAATAAITNLAGGTISGTGGTAVRLYSGTFVNAGTVSGSVDMGYGFPYYSGAATRSYSSSAFVAAGGTVTGDLRFGDADDLFLQTGDATGVSGTIDGGAGTNVYGRSFTSNKTVALGTAGLVNFQDLLVQASGTDTIVTTTGTASGTLYVLGNGSVVNQANLTGALTTDISNSFGYYSGVNDLFPAGQRLASLSNAGTIDGGVSATVGSFTNSGTIAVSRDYAPSVSLYSDMALSFANSGTIAEPGTASSYQPSVSLMAGSSLTLTNSGTVRGGINATAARWSQPTTVTVSASNTGTISSSTWVPALTVSLGSVASGTARIDNGGTIAAQSSDPTTASAIGVALYGDTMTSSNGVVDTVATYAIANSGAITASAAAGRSSRASSAIALVVDGGGLSGTIANAAAGKITAEADRAIAITAGGGALNLTNAGTISAKGKLMAYAVWGDSGDDRVTNTGTITGDIVLGGGADTVRNAGTIAGAVSLGDGNDSFVQSGGGGVSGVIDGGAGTNSFTLSGGTEAAPALFGDIRNFQRLSQTSGFARIGGTAVFGAIDMTGGRMIGQTGSVITAPQITVGQGATFGSAGIVNGNIAVAGMLSPGASPGTMTVNGNVALGSTSTALFEISGSASDRLTVNGALAIAPGATLQLVRLGTVRQGSFTPLLTATGGITGSFTTVQQPSDPLGIVVMRGGEIDLIGAFRNPGNVSPQTGASIAYLNATLAVQPADSALFNGLAALVTADDVANIQAFARLTPQAYAAAVQTQVDDALALVSATRGPGFAASGETPHAFTFGAMLGQWHRLRDDAGQGSVAARSRTYGLLGGIGIGDAAWSVGAFGGYLNDHQYLDALGAHTRANGAVGGIQARARTVGGIGLAGSVSYITTVATTTRTLPVGTASGRYDLHSWVFDGSLVREFAVTNDWAVRPQLGISYVRTVRDALAERGGSPFALTVRRDRNVAGFADGALAFGRADGSAAAFCPTVSFGVRYQIEGLRSDALGGYAGGALALQGYSAARSRVVGTAAGSMSYRLPHRIELFATASWQTGTDDHQEAASGGVRLRF